MNIGKSIKAKREQRKLTTNQLANLIGTSEIYIKKIEEGSADPSIGSVQRICDVLRIEISSLFDGYVEEKRCNKSKTREEYVIKEYPDSKIKEHLIQEITKTLNSVENMIKFHKYKEVGMDKGINEYVRKISETRFFQGLSSGLEEALKTIDKEIDD